MKGAKTSFVGMFQSPTDDMPGVSLVEIPLIQRDYAQGRKSPQADTIRRDFLDVLVAALTGGHSVDLDFVYGEIANGTLRPLDGQQRLTTLFLIHWYVASRLNRLEEAEAWLRFSYATRQTAELFCRELTNPDHHLPEDSSSPSEWIIQQPWYLYGWRHDPTIQSMLVMLDEIHSRFAQEATDLKTVWNRLVDVSNPWISFHLLPIEDMPSGEELYIKMNSRGKPLTNFENFKARFERILSNALSPEEYRTIIHKIDGSWTDVLWQYRNGDRSTDDEFLRYVDFIVEICEWRDGVFSEGSLLTRAERAFGSGSRPSIDLLCHAFDTWIDPSDHMPVDIASEFNSIIAGSTDPEDRNTVALPLFETQNSNLFEQCCLHYGDKRSGRSRVFTLSETLLLYAVLLHRQYDTEDFPARFRVLRNLIDRADDEVREVNMPTLVAETERLIREGDLNGLRGFNADRINDEIAKREYLIQYPEHAQLLRELEDHPLLRGRLFALELDDSLAERAEAFKKVTSRELWPELTGALLAEGDYGIPIKQRVYQYGSAEQESRWRDVLTRRGRGERNRVLREALNRLLDKVGASSDGPKATLQSLINDFVVERRVTHEMDWRYYLVAYPEMRSGSSGIYYGENLSTSGFWDYSMCMLRTDSLSGSAYYRDPFLLAAWNASGVGEGINDPWFRGYESVPRWLRLKASDSGLRCVKEGFIVDPPFDVNEQEKFWQVCHKYGIENELLIRVPQSEVEGQTVDTEDRVQLAASLLRDLVNAGL